MGGKWRVSKKEALAVVVLLVMYVYFRFFAVNTLVFVALSFVVGTWLAFRPSEWAIEGLSSGSKYLGIGAYAAGVLSSLASNTPELVIGGLTAYRGVVTGDVELLDVAVISVLAACGFCILLLGVVAVVAVRQKGRSVEVPYEVLRDDVELMRWSVVALLSIFALGVGKILLESIELLRLQTEVMIRMYVTGEAGVSAYEAFFLFYHFHSMESLELPRVACGVMLASYIAYIIFMFKREGRKGAAEGEAELSRRESVIMAVAGFTGIFLGGEILTSGVEVAMKALPLSSIGEPILLVSFFLGAAGAVPEHGIALVSARRGEIEISLGNLLGGSLQSILMIIGGIGVFVPIPINLYTLFQFAVAAGAIWLLARAITDDGKIDLYEGFSIMLIQSFVFSLMLVGGI